MKKSKILLTLFLIITLTAVISNASYSDVTMSVVEEPTTTIKFGENSTLERSVISKDLEKKEIIMQLKVTNNETSLKPTGEIMLVIDNSTSMQDPVSQTKTRQDLVIDSAKNLITNLLEDNTQLKIGVVSFSTNSDTSKMGTIEDANLVSELTNDTKKLTSAISNIKYDGGQTNLDAGITLAKQYFTNNTDKAHKYMIVLTDGVPNVAIGHKAPYYSEDVFTKTKSDLQSLSSVTDNVIVMLTGIANGDEIIKGAPTEITYNQVVTKVFGTTTNPTIGKFYYVTDDKIEQTIKTDIYKDLLPIKKSLNDLNIKDTFTKEIVENFEFSYVKNPNFGKISDKIDTKTNSITWTIPELKSGETAIVQYKLKLKENYDEDILDKILDTNSNLEIEYKDSGKTDSKSSDITPKVKLTEPTKPAKPEEPKQPTPQEVKKDEEARPKVLPKAGKSAFLISISLASVVTIGLGVKYYLIKTN